MAVDMFLKLWGAQAFPGGLIRGESKDHDHKDEIDIMSWSWGMTQSGGHHQGGAMGWDIKANEKL